MTTYPNWIMNISCSHPTVYFHLVVRKSSWDLFGSWWPWSWRWFLLSLGNFMCLLKIFIPSYLVCICYWNIYSITLEPLHDEKSACSQSSYEKPKVLSLFQLWRKAGGAHHSFKTHSDLWRPCWCICEISDIFNQHQTWMEHQILRPTKPLS